MTSTDRLLMRSAVFIVVRNKAGDILLQQRQNSGFLDGYWDFPSGHIEPGERIIEAAKRELEEEVGIRTDIDDLKLVNLNQNNLDIQYVNFTFLAENWRGEPKIGEPEKVADVRFFPLDDLPQKCSLGVRVIEHAGFPTELTHSFVDYDNLVSLMREPYDSSTWGKK